MEFGGSAENCLTQPSVFLCASVLKILLLATGKVILKFVVIFYTTEAQRNTELFFSFIDASIFYSRN